MTGSTSVANVKKVMVLGVVVVLAMPSIARSEPRRPALAVIRDSSAAGDGAAKESRFVEELTLTLGDMGVDVVSEGMPGYAAMALPSQLALLEPRFRDGGWIAAAWLTALAQDRYVLCVVVWGTGRAMVRLLEADGASDFEADLALAAAELLGAAYLFDEPRGESDPMRRLEKSARDKVVALGAAPQSTPPPSPAPSRTAEMPGPSPRPAPPATIVPKSHRDLSFEAQGSWNAGLFSGLGPRHFLGGNFGIALALRVGFFARLGVEVLGGPIDAPEGARIRSTSAAPTVGLAYFVARGNLAFGPSAEIGARGSVVTVEASDHRATAFRTWEGIARVGVELRYEVVSPLAFTLGMGLYGSSRQDLYRLEGTGRDVYETWRLGFYGRLGVALGSKI